MKVKRATCVCARAGAILVLLILFFSSNLWAGQATVQLKGTLDQIIKVFNDPSLKTAEKKDERRDAISKLLKKRFDEEEFAKRALGAHWRKRTEEEKQEFVSAFTDLLENTYFNKLDSYVMKAGSFSSDNIHYLNERMIKRYAVVETQIVVDKATEIPVAYKLKNKEGNWVVCDLAVEGVSLVKNYRAQFNEILAGSSFKELMAKLDAKK